MENLHLTPCATPFDVGLDQEPRYHSIVAPAAESRPRTGRRRSM